MSILPMWYALQVRCKREHAVALSLTTKGYEVFLPVYSDRPHADQPLFTGYLFCRVGPNVVGKMVTTPNAIRIVGGPTPVAIDEEEIERVRRFARSNVPL